MKATTMTDGGEGGQVGAPQSVLMSGSEPIRGTGLDVRAFWAWTLSDLRTNTVRPMLAEFLVATALDVADRPRVEWDPYDVRTSDGVCVEVKSAAYLQSWAQARPSTITFGGLTSRVWEAAGGRAEERSYNADVYVFAVVTAREHAQYDAIDTGQWSFWVLPRAVVEATGQRSLRLTRVQALAGPPVAYADLAEHIRTAAAPPRPVDGV